MHKWNWKQMCFCCRFSGDLGLELCVLCTKTMNASRTPTSRNFLVFMSLVMVRHANNILLFFIFHCVYCAGLSTKDVHHAIKDFICSLFSPLSGCRRDKDGYYWITGRIDDMLNVSGIILLGFTVAPFSKMVIATPNHNFTCCVTHMLLRTYLIYILLYNLSLMIIITFPILLFLSSRPPDEHIRGGGGSGGASGCGGVCGGESASQGEGRVSLLLRHPQKQQGVYPHTGGGTQETRWDLVKLYCFCLLYLIQW